MDCRYCNKPILGTSVMTKSYWKGLPFESHPECKEAGFWAEVIDCQTIDADCNDCRHFKRGEVIKRWLSCMEDKKPSMRLVNMGIITGHCLKFNKPALGHPNAWTGNECFEHRRSK